MQRLIIALCSTSLLFCVPTASAQPEPQPDGQQVQSAEPQSQPNSQQAKPPEAQPGEWKEYVFAEDGFAISAIAEPTFEDRPIFVVGGTSSAHIYTIPAGDSGVFMMFIFERNSKDKRGEEQVRKEAQQAALAGANGKLRASKEVVLGKFKGVEMEFDAEHPEIDLKKQQIKNRYYVIGRRIYHLMAIAPDGQSFPPDTDRWMKSFRIVPIAAQ